MISNNKQDAPDKLKEDLETEYYSYDYIFTYRTYTGWGKKHFYDFCVLTDKENPERKVLRFQKRFFGITKKMTGAGETNPRWIVYDKFNLNVKKDFPSFYKILQKFKDGKLEQLEDLVESLDFSLPVHHMESLKNDLKKFEKTNKKSNEVKNELKKKNEKIIKLNDQIKQLNEENRNLKIQSIKTNINEYKGIIKKIKYSLTKEADNEPCFQKYFSDNKWIFGPWFEDVIPKRKADIKNEPDFVLKRFDGFCDVVEIEAPGKELFTKPNKSNKSQPKAELTQAFSQIIDYIDSYMDNYKNEFYKDYESGLQNPLNPYKPRGLVIIGRDKTSERKKLRQFNSFLNHITILTYDEFLRNVESMLDFIEKK